MPIALALAVLVLAAFWLLVFYDNGHAGFAHRPAAPRADEQRAEGSLRTVHFPACDGARLEGWLFLPHAAAPPPLVLMAPGLTGTKEGHLEPFAWRFARAGLAVLLFDFRSFGGSSGEPRHWVDPARHGEDYASALAFVRRDLGPSGRVDAERVALWGSSFSGGTALVAAANDPCVRAVVAQCPFLSTSESQQPGPRQMVWFVFWTVLDSLRDRLGLRPIYLPAFGRPGELVFAKSAENPPALGFDPAAGHAFWGRMPRDLRGGWENKLLARVFATLDRAPALDHVERIGCPVYLIAGERDDMVPSALVRNAYARLRSPACNLSVHECGHFDLYLDDVFERNVELQASFLAGALEKDGRPSAA